MKPATPDIAQREGNYENFVEYCKARRKGFEGLEDYAQPLIEVSRVHTVTNHLNPTSRPSTASKKDPAKCKHTFFRTQRLTLCCTDLIPELCCRMTLPSR